jgi:hypothetical protein
MCDCLRCLGLTSEKHDAKCIKCVEYKSIREEQIKKKSAKWTFPRSQIDISSENAYLNHVKMRRNIETQFSQLSIAAVQDPDVVYIDFLIKKIECDMIAILDAYDLPIDDPLFVMMLNARKEFEKVKANSISDYLQKNMISVKI